MKGRITVKKGICLTLIGLILCMLALPALAGDGIVTIWANGNGGTVTDWDNNAILKEIEARTGTDIQIVWIPDGYSDQLNAAAASGDMPDIITRVDVGAKTMIQMWVDGGIVAPITGEIAEAAPNWTELYDVNQGLNEIRFNDDIYICPISWGTGNAPNSGLVHVRADLMEKYGIEQIDTYEQYVDYLRQAVEDGHMGITFNGSEGLANNILNVFLGGMGLPMTGWVKQDDGSYSHWSVQPEVGDAINMLRELIAEGLVDPGVWSCDSDTARTNYVSGNAASFIFNGGGHIGRIQNDMMLIDESFKEELLPALDFGNGVRGYSQEDMYSGGTMLGNTSNCDPVEAAKVVNFLISPEGYELCAIGIEGVDFERDGDDIVWLDARFEDGFPTEALDAGAHPLASGIVSWQPQEWQDFTLLYGKDDEYKQWYNEQFSHQTMYQIENYGRNITVPSWTEFQSTATELYNRYAIEAVNATSAEEVTEIWQNYINEWMQSGGEQASADMSAKLQETYAE